MITNHQSLRPQTDPDKAKGFRSLHFSMLLMAAVAVGWLMSECAQEPMISEQAATMGVAEVGEGFLACLTVAFVLNIVNEPRHKN